MFFRVVFGPVLFAALVVALGATAACGSDDATPTSTSVAGEPTATATPGAEPTSTSTPSPTPSPTATPTAVPTATPTAVPPRVVVSDFTCTQTFPGVFNPDGPVSDVFASADVTNVGETAVPVKISAANGAIFAVEFLDAEGGSALTLDSTAAGVLSLEPGETHTMSLGGPLYETPNIESCKLIVLAPESFGMPLEGDVVEIEKIYAP